MKNTLKTNRLTLKHLNENDPNDCQGIVNLFGKRDTVWWADLLEPVQLVEEAQDFIHWHNHNKEGVSLYGIYAKGEPWLLGTIQVTLFHSLNIMVAELGYALSYESRRNGFMTEAVNAICDMLFEEPGMVEIRCHILPNNYSSLRVATYCGFEYVDEKWYEKMPRNRDDYYLDEYVLKRYEHERLKEGGYALYEIHEKINKEEDLYEQLAA